MWEKDFFWSASSSSAAAAGEQRRIRTSSALFSQLPPPPIHSNLLLLLLSSRFAKNALKSSGDGQTSSWPFSHAGGFWSDPSECSRYASARRLAQKS